MGWNTKQGKGIHPLGIPSDPVSSPVPELLNNQQTNNFTVHNNKREEILVLREIAGNYK